MDEHASLWVALGGFCVAVATIAGGFMRYVISLLRDFDRAIDDKVSIGEYNRRHEDLERTIHEGLEKRVRALERWQDHANGRYYQGPVD